MCVFAMRDGREMRIENMYIVIEYSVERNHYKMVTK